MSTALGNAASHFVGGVVGAVVGVPHKGAGAAEYYAGSCSKCTQASRFWSSRCPSRTVGSHEAVAASQLVYDAEHHPALHGQEAAHVSGAVQMCMHEYRSDRAQDLVNSSPGTSSRPTGSMRNFEHLPGCSFLPATTQAMPKGLHRKILNQLLV